MRLWPKRRGSGIAKIKGKDYRLVGGVKEVRKGEMNER